MIKAILKPDQLPVVTLLQSRDLAKTVAKARREVSQGQAMTLEELKAELKF